MTMIKNVHRLNIVVEFDHCFSRPNEKNLNKKNNNKQTKTKQKQKQKQKQNKNKKKKTKQNKTKKNENILLNYILQINILINVQPTNRINHKSN